YRCLDCFLPDLTCADCCRRRHIRNPFHKIQEWDGRHFKSISLGKLELVLQLGHLSMFCPNPKDCHQNFRVLHHGIHDIPVQFCGCATAPSKAIQLLRRGLYPATSDVPKTCATFRYLEHLHVHSLCSKSTTYDFHRALRIQTDNTGVTIPPSRYNALKRMFTQW
ncbi:hypothetical protein K435DRAFT_686065, partial [Dendrothele bispora CBS 962.96]